MKPTTKKPSAAALSTLRGQMTRLKKRLALVESKALHWYAVGKTPDGPCKQCDLLISDRIHKDSIRV